jgi:hypothetical protein
MDHQIVHALIDAWLKEPRRRPYRDLVFAHGGYADAGSHGAKMDRNISWKYMHFGIARRAEASALSFLGMTEVRERSGL